MGRVGSCGPKAKESLNNRTMNYVVMPTSRLFTLFCTDRTLTTQIYTMIPRKDSCKSNTKAGRKNSDSSGIFINTKEILLFSGLVFYKKHWECWSQSSDWGTVINSHHSRLLDLRNSQRNKGCQRSTLAIIYLFVCVLGGRVFFVFCFVNLRLSNTRKCLLNIGIFSIKVHSGPQRRNCSSFLDHMCP